MCSGRAFSAQFLAVPRLPTTQPAPSRAIFPAPGTRDCFAEAPRQTLQQIRAKRCSDGASRSVTNISHCRFWVHRACFVSGLSLFWSGLAKCAKLRTNLLAKSSDEPLHMSTLLTRRAVNFIHGYLLVYLYMSKGFRVHIFC